MMIECEGCGTKFEVKGDFAFHHCPNDSCQWVYWASENTLNSSYAPVPASQVTQDSYIYLRGMDGPARILNVAPSTSKGKTLHIAIKGWGSKNCNAWDIFWVEQ